MSRPNAKASKTKKVRAPRARPAVELRSPSENQPFAADQELAQLRSVANWAAHSLYAEGLFRVTPRAVLEEAMRATMEDLTFYSVAFEGGDSWNRQLVHRLFERIENRLRLAVELAKLPPFDLTFGWHDHAKGAVDGTDEHAGDVVGGAP